MDHLYQSLAVLNPQDNEIDAKILRRVLDDVYKDTVTNAHDSVEVEQRPRNLSAQVVR